jgi:deazaflavin-dependent oxidoreductase (nitroreductase family)
VIRHRGRRSGKEYAAPVVVKPIEEGFIVPLPYGEDVDWLKNVQAAGRATVEAKGETYAVGEPDESVRTRAEQPAGTLIAQDLPHEAPCQSYSSEPATSRPPRPRI